MTELHELKDFQEFMLSNDPEHIAETVMDWLRSADQKTMGKALQSYFLSMSDEAFAQLRAL